MHIMQLNSKLGWFYPYFSPVFPLGLFIVFAFPFFLTAQSSSKINGIITDKSSGEPLIGAYIVLEGTGFGVATDFDGSYQINNIPSGHYKLTISYIGYDDVSEEIELVGGTPLVRNIALDYSGVQLGAATITAQAKGQVSAINNQLNSKSIKNVVSGEKLQELPDANAAESIGRLPGVSVLRTGGEGSKVVIRGMSPKYNKIMIEGVSMASSDNDRSSDISIVSPYSLGAIEVFKAVSADKDADFIGGAVNFKLREADAGWHSGLVAQGGFNQLKQTHSDYLLVGNVSNRFLGNKLGIYLQGNLERRNRSSNNLSAEYELRNPQIDQVNKVYTRRLILTDAIRQKNRKGVTMVADYKGGDWTAHFKNFVNNGVTEVNRYQEYYTVPTRQHSFLTRDERYDVTTLSSLLDLEYSRGPWKIYTKLSHASTSRDVPLDLSFLFNQEGALRSEVLDDNIAPTSLIDFSVNNDSLSYLSTLNESYSQTKEQQQEVKTDIQYDFALSKKWNGYIKFGGKYRVKGRAFNKDVATGNYQLNSGQEVKDAILRAFPEMQNIAPLGSTRLPYALFRRDFDHGDFLNGDYQMGPVGDLELLHKVLDVIKGVPNPAFETYSKHDYYSVREDYHGNEYLYAGYLMSELNLGPNLKFLPGLRYENNKTVYTAPRGDAGLAFPNQHYVYSDTTITRQNAFLLPMMHLKYSPLEWLNLRLAYTQTLSRPAYNLIVPRVDLLTDAVIWNNYKLRPEFSTNYDAYLSFHNNKLGLLTIGGFTKKVKDMIFWLGRRVILDPGKYELPEETLERFIFTQANNTYDATLKGVEVDWQTNFWYLPGAWKGLVFSINYTHINSKAKYPRTIVEKEFDPVEFKYKYNNLDTFIVGQLQLQPDDIINVQLGYDIKGFSARISMLYQSRVFKRPDFWPELINYSDAYLRFDFSARQKLPWYGMEVFTNMNNFTSAIERDLVNGAQWDAGVQQYGMTVDLGLRMKW